MKRVAILGGSFNPFHNGHAAMVQAAREQLNIDEIWLLPAKQPPHKQSYGNISDDDRVGMLRAYAASYEDVHVYTIELEMDGFTYTANTLTSLHEMYSDYSFIFLIGGDSIVNFHKWYQPETIVKYADIAICTRDDCDLKDVETIISNLISSFGGRFIPLKFKNVDVSSTMVRKLLAEKRDAGSYIPKEIYDYILTKKLYIDNKEQYTVHELEFKMKELLPDKRFKHVLGVKETAVKLAEIYNCNVLKASIAALLHDCAKTLTSEQLVNLCDQNGVSYTPEETCDEFTTKSLLHSKAGSILAKNLYYINDEEILSAIFYHTVGRPNMSLLEKIIFVADYIEPGRTQSTNPPLDEIRNIAYNNIDNAVYLIALNTVHYLKENKRYIDSATMQTLDYYKNLK